MILRKIGADVVVCINHFQFLVNCSHSLSLLSLSLSVVFLIIKFKLFSFCHPIYLLFVIAPYLCLFFVDFFLFFDVLPYSPFCTFI